MYGLFSVFLRHDGYVMYLCVDVVFHVYAHFWHFMVWVVMFVLLVSVVVVIFMCVGAVWVVSALYRNVGV